METTISRINKEVNVNAFYFNQHKDFKTFPKQIEFDGTNYTFIENGLRLLVQKGQQFVELFDMSDGRSTFRLRQEAGHWTLVGIKALV
ncbi:MAG TPA: hypothetical protein VMR75_00840 [Candidatus Saccharimonadales bacterium]|nr:hypothetical protein [Candidatus Saccharimonadales bacterium]